MALTCSSKSPFLWANQKENASLREKCEAAAVSVSFCGVACSERPTFLTNKTGQAEQMQFLLQAERTSVLEGGLWTIRVIGPNFAF